MGFLVRLLTFLIHLSLFLLFVVLKLDGTTTWLWHYITFVDLRFVYADPPD